MYIQEKGMLNTEVFKSRLAQQLEDFGMEAKGSWAIAPEVFVARVRQKEECDWTFVFYHDVSQTAFRDSRRVHRTVQLLMNGFESGVLSKDGMDTLRIFHLAGGVWGECPVGSSANAINIASQLLTAVDGSEIAWFSVPQPV